MKYHHVLLASALALAACSKSPAPEASVTAPPAEPAPAANPAQAASEPAPAATEARPATVVDCTTTIEANDAMQYNADAIAVPASCTQFTIHLKHVGKMPVAAMGHNVVIARLADIAGIVADGMSVAPEHIKADDPRVIAHSRMIGGGESAAVNFDVASIKNGGPFSFFCSFPGHSALMQGSLQVQ
jgi:azurin